MSIVGSYFRTKNATKSFSMRLVSDREQELEINSHKDKTAVPLSLNRLVNHIEIHIKQVAIAEKGTKKLSIFTGAQVYT